MIVCMYHEYFSCNLLYRVKRAVPIGTGEEESVRSVKKRDKDVVVNLLL